MLHSFFDYWRLTDLTAMSDEYIQYMLHHSKYRMWLWIGSLELPWVSHWQEKHGRGFQFPEQWHGQDRVGSWEV